MHLVTLTKLKFCVLWKERRVGYEENGSSVFMKSGSRLRAESGTWQKWLSSGLS